MENVCIVVKDTIWIVPHEHVFKYSRKTYMISIVCHIKKMTNKTVLCAKVVRY